jgi:hypothetical protein
VTEWLVLVFRIRWESGWSFVPRPAILTGFSLFSSAPQGKLWYFICTDPVCYYDIIGYYWPSTHVLIFKFSSSPTDFHTAIHIQILYTIHPSIHPRALQPISGLGLLYWDTVTVVFLWCGVVSPTPNPNLEDQVSVYMTPGDRVAQLYHQVLGSSGTSGVPLPVPIIVGPWGEFSTPAHPTYNAINIITTDFQLKNSQISKGSNNTTISPNRIQTSKT